MSSNVYAWSGRNKMDLQAKTMYANSVVTANLLGLVPNDSSSTVATNNTAIINMALSQGGNIILPAGRYYINGNLHITMNNTVLSGQGRGVTTLILTTATTGTIYTIFIDCVTPGNLISNVAVRNLTIDGQADLSSATYVAGVLMLGAFAAIIQNVQCYNIKGDSFVFDGNTYDSRSSICYVIECVSEYPTNRHAYIAELSQDCVVENCFFQYAGGDGIKMDSFGGKVRNSHSYRNLGHGIYISSLGARNEVNSCILDTNSRWGTVIAGSYENLIHDNLYFQENLSLNSQGAISLIKDGSTPSNRNIIKGNLIYDDGGMVTSFSGANGLYYTGRAATVTTDKGIGIATGCFSNIFKLNEVTGQIPQRFFLEQTDGNLIEDELYNGLFSKDVQGIRLISKGLSTDSSGVPLGFNSWFNHNGTGWVNINTASDFSAAINFTDTGKIQFMTCTGATGSIDSDNGRAINPISALSIDKNQVVSVDGGLRTSVTTISTTANIPLNFTTLKITGTSGNISLNLPLVSTCPGQEYRVIKQDANLTTFVATGANISFIPSMSGPIAGLIMNDSVGSWYRVS